MLRILVRDLRLLLLSLEEDHHAELRGAPLVPQDDHKALEAAGVTDDHPDVTPDETLAPQGEKIDDLDDDQDLMDRTGPCQETLVRIFGEARIEIEDAPLLKETTEAFEDFGGRVEGALSHLHSP